MIDSEQLRHKIDIYIPPQGFDCDKAFNDYMECQKALDRFLNLECTPRELEEILYGYGTDMDDYEDCLEFNLSH